MTDSEMCRAWLQNLELGSIVLYHGVLFEKIEESRDFTTLCCIEAHKAYMGYGEGVLVRVKHFELGMFQYDPERSKLKKRWPAPQL